MLGVQLIEVNTSLEGGSVVATTQLAPLELVLSTWAEPESSPAIQQELVLAHDIDAIEVIDAGWLEVALQLLPPLLVKTSGLELVVPAT